MSTDPESIDVAELYPDLMEGFTEEQVWNFCQVFAANAHEGWIPNRPDVELFVKFKRGEITRAQYLAAMA